MSNERPVGALWLNKEYGSLSGTIEIDGKQVKVIAFKNKYKTENKHPDFQIFKRREQQPNPKPEDDTEVEPF